MDKAGSVYRHILEAALKNRKARFSVRAIARELKISPDTASKAVVPLKRIGAVSAYGNYFEVSNFKKALLFWAVKRKLHADIAYSTYSETRDIGTIENHMPSGIAYTAFSGYTKCFGNDAAAYGEVYVYADDEAMKEIARRFPLASAQKRGALLNVFVLRPDSALESDIAAHRLQHSSAPITQMYVDLWNMESWNAYEFLVKLEKRIDDAYAKAILE